MHASARPLHAIIMRPVLQLLRHVRRHSPCAPWHPCTASLASAPAGRSTPCPWTRTRAPPSVPSARAWCLRSTDTTRSDRECRGCVRARAGGGGLLGCASAAPVAVAGRRQRKCVARLACIGRDSSGKRPASSGRWPGRFDLLAWARSCCAAFLLAICSPTPPLCPGCPLHNLCCSVFAEVRRPHRTCSGVQWCAHYGTAAGAAAAAAVGTFNMACMASTAVAPVCKPFSSVPRIRQDTATKRRLLPLLASYPHSYAHTPMPPPASTGSVIWPGPAAAVPCFILPLFTSSVRQIAPAAGGTARRHQLLQCRGPAYCSRALPGGRAPLGCGTPSNKLKSLSTICGAGNGARTGCSPRRCKASLRGTSALLCAFFPCNARPTPTRGHIPTFSGVG